MDNSLAEKYGYLRYMIERYIKLLGRDETINLLEANEKLLIPTIRINTLKVEIKSLIEKLQSKGFKLEKLDWIDYGYKITKVPMNLGSLHEYLQGYYYLQSYASMIPVHILDPKPWETVVDMCAAPGSKSTQISQLMQNTGILILFDKNEKRIPALNANLSRMGVVNSILINQDAINLPKLGIEADKVLLDAPCTGEGLIRRDPKRKTSRTMHDIRKLQNVQAKLLEAGLSSLKKGGRLVYSTCSIAPEENEMVIDKIVKKNDGIKIIEMKDKIGLPGLTEFDGIDFTSDLKYAQRMYPHTHDSEGFFFCLMKKNKE
jgi:NOL1/NOP2/sun family putative RNA methylase